MKQLAATVLGLLLGFPAAAQWDLRGEIDLEGSYSDNAADSLDAALGERDHADLEGRLRLRLMAARTWSSGWGLELAWLAEARAGGGVALNRAQHALFPDAFVDPDHTSLLRLNHTLTDHGQRYADHRLDRLVLSWSGEHLVLRLGRQALTWGGGLVFHPMDLFDPFAPDATYTAYKPGTDMLYGQWLFDSGSDLQGVLVPRREPATGAVTADASSAGLKWHGFVGAEQQLGLDLLLARDYRDPVLGIGLDGPLGGATWGAEAVVTDLADGGLRTSLLANLRYAWVWNGRNLDAYLELFRNGFGVGGSDTTLDALPPALTARLARGELFTVSRNYLAAGIDLQWTPLLDLKPSLIVNLDDGSALLVGQAVYSLDQDTRLTAGFRVGLGGRGSEYGGLETATGSGVYDRPADRLYLRITRYL